MSRITRSLRELTRYPSAIAGLLVVLGLIALALYAIISMPYREAIRLWRGGEEIWAEYPKNAQPIWTDWFTSERRPRSIILSTADGTATKTVDEEGGTGLTLTFPFDYDYEGFPQDLVVFLTAEFEEKRPHASFTWVTPDGREVRMGDLSVRPAETFRPVFESRLQRRLGGLSPEIGLFAVPDEDPPRPLAGTYQMVVDVYLFEPDSDVDAKMVLHGQVHGIAGTDHRRRDLTVALLWGTPIALPFGLLAALGTTVTTMVIAAIGVWFGGWADSAIQRVTELNMILPFLPILIMVGTLYNRSIWVILGVVIALGLFGSSIKTYRAVFLQVKESPYIEAARAYGAGNMRIIVYYMLPRIVPMLIPQLVVLIPTYVFLEASLAQLGLGDPILPTWGKLISEARDNGALFQGWYYWMLEPAALLMLTGLGFALLGFAMDRIFNPRLREL
ncbi:MAG: ABC transporter permease [Chloroflexi bacterium]|nr:ABC transporter permease [Chloroflexota bacterium]